MRLKPCSVCNRLVYLWQSKPPLCKDCHRKANPTLIAKVSSKRKVENKAYLTLRKVYLETHTLCKAQLDGCTGHATEIHHLNDRNGERLNDVRYFMPICRNCHTQIHDKLSAQEARQLGLLT